MYRILLFSK